MPRSVGQRLWKLLVSTRTAIILIGFIMVSAMAAGLVPQGQESGYYMARYGAVWGEIICRTGLAGAFTSWWFIGAESLLFISLTACVIKRTRHAWRKASFFPFKHSPDQMHNSAWCLVYQFPGSDWQQAVWEAENLAREQGFKCLHKEEGKTGRRLSGLRHRWAYLLSPVLHLGLALLLLGLILTPFTSLNEYYEVGEGDVIALRDDGYPFDLLVKDFQIEYYDNYQPRQYASRLVILADDGSETAEEVISVNHPLRHAGVKAYQSSWGWVLDGVLTTGDKREPFSVFDGRDTSVGHGPDPVKVSARFYPDVYLGFDGVPDSRTPEPRNPGMLYRVERPGAQPQMGLASLGEKHTLDGVGLEFSGFRYYTGLQIKMEPLLPLIFLGFALALSGLVLFYLIRPHRGL